MMNQKDLTGNTQEEVNNNMSQIKASAKKKMKTSGIVNENVSPNVSKKGDEFTQADLSSNKNNTVSTTKRRQSFLPTFGKQQQFWSPMPDQAQTPKDSVSRIKPPSSKSSGGSSGGRLSLIPETKRVSKASRKLDMSSPEQLPRTKIQMPTLVGDKEYKTRLDELVRWKISKTPIETNESPMCSRVAPSLKNRIPEMTRKLQEEQDMRVIREILNGIMDTIVVQAELELMEAVNEANPETPSIMADDLEDIEALLASPGPSDDIEKEMQVTLMEATPAGESDETPEEQESLDTPMLETVPMEPAVASIESPVESSSVPSHWAPTSPNLQDAQSEDIASVTDLQYVVSPPPIITSTAEFHRPSRSSPMYVGWNEIVNKWETQPHFNKKEPQRVNRFFLYGGLFGFVCAVVSLYLSLESHPVDIMEQMQHSFNEFVNELNYDQIDVADLYQYNLADVATEVEIAPSIAVIEISSIENEGETAVNLEPPKSEISMVPEVEVYEMQEIVSDNEMNMPQLNEEIVMNVVDDITETLQVADSTETLQIVDVVDDITETLQVDDITDTSQVEDVANIASLPMPETPVETFDETEIIFSSIGNEISESSKVENAMEISSMDDTVVHESPIETDPSPETFPHIDDIIAAQSQTVQYVEAEVMQIPKTLPIIFEEEDFVMDDKLDNFDQLSRVFIEIENSPHTDDFLVDTLFGLSLEATDLESSNKMIFNTLYENPNTKIGSKLKRSHSYEYEWMKHTAQQCIVDTKPPQSGTVTPVAAAEAMLLVLAMGFSCVLVFNYAPATIPDVVVQPIEHNIKGIRQKLKNRTEDEGSMDVIEVSQVPGTPYVQMKSVRRSRRFSQGFDLKTPIQFPASHLIK